MSSKLKITIFFLFFAVCFSAADASADYYNWGVLKSDNILSGATVTAINGFNVTSSIPAGGAVSVQFSQDWVNWYSSTSTIWAWDICSDGTTNIDLTGLGWSGGLLFYKLKLETTDAAATPSVTDIQVDYDGTEVPPDSGIRYPNEGTLVSTDLLAGLGGNLNGSEKFGYNITSLPAGTAVYAQFSQDGANWYNSTGTQWGWDTLSAGDHLESGAALDLSGLGWSGDNFYYKLKLTSIDLEQTPVVSEVNLLRKATQINAPITDKFTGGLVGNWSFNGPDMDWASTTAEALDRSGNANHGNVVNGAKPAAGKAGQGMSFDGVDDYVSSNFQFSIFNFQSISQFINFQTLAAGKPIIGKWGNSQNAILIKTDDTNNDELKICVASGLTDDCANAASTTDANLTVKNWHNLQVVYDGTQSTNADKLKLYLDGSQKTLSFIGTIPAVLQNSSANLEIGGDSDLSDYTNCLIDEVRIYNRALSADEIGQLYRSGARTMKIIPTKSGKTIIKP